MTDYEDKADKKDTNFDVNDKDDMTKKLFRRCHYCGKPPERLHGLDKVKPGPNPGYTAGNTVSCCWPCNSIKRDNSVEDVKSSVAAVVKTLGLAKWREEGFPEHMLLETFQQQCPDFSPALLDTIRQQFSTLDRLRIVGACARAKRYRGRQHIIDEDDSDEEATGPPAKPATKQPAQQQHKQKEPPAAAPDADEEVLEAMGGPSSSKAAAASGSKGGRKASTSASAAAPASKRQKKAAGGSGNSKAAPAGGKAGAALLAKGSGGKAGAAGGKGQSSILSFFGGGK